MISQYELYGTTHTCLLKSVSFPVKFHCFVAERRWRKTGNRSFMIAAEKSICRLLDRASVVWTNPKFHVKISTETDCILNNIITDENGERGHSAINVITLSQKMASSLRCSICPPKQWKHDTKSHHNPLAKVYFIEVKLRKHLENSTWSISFKHKVDIWILHTYS